MVQSHNGNLRKPPAINQWSTLFKFKASRGIIYTESEKQAMRGVLHGLENADKDEKKLPN